MSSSVSRQCHFSESSGALSGSLSRLYNSFLVLRAGSLIRILSAMAYDDAGSVQGHIELLSLELELLEEWLIAPDLKPQDARTLLSQVDTLRSEYMSLAEKLQGFGSPSSRDERLTILKCILAVWSKASSLAPVSSSVGGSHFVASGPGSSQLQAKLPQINLPMFSGGADAWIGRSRAFSSAVDGRENLTSDAKLQYLLTSISGEALRLVSESKTTGASYSMVMRQLHDRYEDRASILKYYLRRFLNPGRAKLLDCVRGAENSLMARGYLRSELFDPVGCFILLEHLPPSIRSAWDLLDKEDFEFSELCRFIENRARKAPAVPPPPSDGPSTLAASSSKSAPSSGALALPWRNKDAPQRDKRHIFAIDARGHCIGCGVSAVHPLHHCPDYRRLDAMQRLRLVRTHGRCENCLAPGHRDQECRSRSCLVCGGSHHTSLHDAPRGAAAQAVVSAVASDPLEDVSGARRPKYIAPHSIRVPHRRPPKPPLPLRPRFLRLRQPGLPSPTPLSSRLSLPNHNLNLLIRLGEVFRCSPQQFCGSLAPTALSPSLAR